MSRLIPQAAGSAPVARARLQSLLEYDRSLISHADLLSVLRDEIFALVGRHAAIDANKVHFMVIRTSTAATLTVDIEVPFPPDGDPVWA
jgi:cell division topological specificity factor